jgi:hypothetical protein
MVVGVSWLSPFIHFRIVFENQSDLAHAPLYSTVLYRTGLGWITYPWGRARHCYRSLLGLMVRSLNDIGRERRFSLRMVLRALGRLAACWKSEMHIVIPSRRNQNAILVVEESIVPRR